MPECDDEPKLALTWLNQAIADWEDGDVSTVAENAALVVMQDPMLAVFILSSAVMNLADGFERVH
jgi:hypothetical protein